MDKQLNRLEYYLVSTVGSSLFDLKLYDQVGRMIYRYMNGQMNRQIDRQIDKYYLVSTVGSSPFDLVNLNDIYIYMYIDLSYIDVWMDRQIDRQIDI